MSKEQNQTEQADSLSGDPRTVESVIEQSAELIAEWVRRYGGDAHPLYFACGASPCATGADFPLPLGPLRYHFAEAQADAQAYSGSVSFLIRFAHPDFPL